MRRMVVRSRLALVYGLVGLLVSAALLATALVTADRAVRAQVIDAPRLSVSVPDGATTEQAAAAKAELARAQQAIQSQYRDGVLTEVLRRGLLAAALCTLVALILGWYVAGAALRPLAAITGTARRIADRNLHERVEQTGRRDEWGELAVTMNAMLSRLDEAFAAQRQFVGNASHELKTPIAINRTLIEVAMSRPDASADLLRLADNLLAVNDRHEKLVDGMLTLARAERRVMSAEALNLAEVVDDVLDLLRPEAEDNRVKVHRAIEVVAVDGDAGLLERLVQNLVQNAIRHNEPDGDVWVQVGPAGDRARFAVTNSGPVVPAAAVPHLFEPFTRVAGRIRSVQGTGLGLSIALAVVQAHDGTVTMTPRPEGGLLVEVYLQAVEISE
jgi:signal transduction histidine kinase